MVSKDIMEATMNQQELYTYGISYLKEKRPNLDLSEGSISYDLLTPLSYMEAELYNHLDEIKNELNPIYAKEKMLEYWAEPRIGKRKEATKTRILVQGDDFSHRTWFYKDQTFTKIEEVEVTKAILEAENIGRINIQVGETLQAENSSSILVTVLEIQTIGSEEENIEVYRQRYINSLLVDSQIGLGTTYSQRIQAHEDVSVAIVDYLQSKNGEVNVFLLNAEYEMITNLEELNQYFTQTEPIVPFGQKLVLQALAKSEITVTISYSGNGLTPEVVLDYLRGLNRSYYIPNLAKTKDVTYTINNILLRNKMISDFTEYGIIDTVDLSILGITHENILLDHQYPVWVQVNILKKEIPR